MHLPLSQNSNTCKNCSNNFSGKFCNICGEKAYKENDKSILHFFEEGMHFITHFEGTLFTTINTVFSSPGKLSVDYCNGIRKKYFKPIPFFLLLVVLYLFFPVFKGLNMNMEYYKGQAFYGSYAKATIEKVQAQTGYNEVELANKFHYKSEKVSKFLLIILIPLSAIFFYIVTFFKRKYYFDSFVFAAEINSFYLLWGFFCVPLLATVVILISRLFNYRFDVGDPIISPTIYIALCLYTSLAIKKFYGFKTWKSIVVSLLFAVVHTFIVYVLYKFLLFSITIHQIH